MHTQLSAIARTLHRILHRLSRKARIKLGITVSLPPFLKIALDYSADIGERARKSLRSVNGRAATQTCGCQFVRK